jgi:hypothetical protein
MMMTVAQYAESRDLSEATVKKHIKKLELELPCNPNDRRQRLISRENQQALDQSTRRSAPPSPAAIEPPIEVIPYQRSEEAAMVIAEGEIIKAQHLVPYQSADQNPLLIALQRQAAELQQSNLARYHQIQNDNQTQQEAQQAIAAAKRIRLMEAAQQEAFENHQLKKQLLAQATTELELMDMGLSVNNPPVPTKQTVPQSSAPERSPDWL